MVTFSAGILVTRVPRDRRYVHSPGLLTPYQVVGILGEVSSPRISTFSSDQLPLLGSFLRGRQRNVWRRWNHSNSEGKRSGATGVLSALSLLGCRLSCGDWRFMLRACHWQFWAWALTWVRDPHPCGRHHRPVWPTVEWWQMDRWWGHCRSTTRSSATGQSTFVRDSGLDCPPPWGHRCPTGAVCGWGREATCQGSGCPSACGSGASAALSLLSLRAREVVIAQRDENKYSALVYVAHLVFSA